LPEDLLLRKNSYEQHFIKITALLNMMNIKNLFRTAADELRSSETVILWNVFTGSISDSESRKHKQFTTLRMLGRSCGLRNSVGLLHLKIISILTWGWGYASYPPFIVEQLRWKFLGFQAASSQTFNGILHMDLERFRNLSLISKPALILLSWQQCNFIHFTKQS